MKCVFIYFALLSEVANASCLRGCLSCCGSVIHPEFYNTFDLVNDIAREIYLRDSSQTPHRMLIDAEGQPILSNEMWVLGTQIEGSATTFFVRMIGDDPMALNYILKFHSTHSRIGLYDTIILEYAMGVFLSRLNIGPNVLWISGPRQEPGWCLVRLFCPRPIERYIITESEGISLDVYFERHMQGRNVNAIDYLNNVFTLTEQWLDLIKRMHDFGLVHGNVTGKTIVFKRGSGILLLTDFSRTGFAIQSESTCNDPADDDVDSMSIWQLRDCAYYGYRDDVYRVFETMSNWISMGNLQEVKASFMQHNLVLLAFKSGLNFFRKNRDYDPFLRISQSIRNEIVVVVGNCLSASMSHIESLSFVSSPVNFVILRNALRCARRALRGTPEVSQSEDLTHVDV